MAVMGQVWHKTCEYGGDSERAWAEVVAAPGPDALLAAMERGEITSEEFLRRLGLGE